MPKMKKDNPFEALRQEAAEAGVTLAQAVGGTYTGFVTGGATLEEYANPRELLDDLLALKEMDATDSVYTYDSTEFDEAVVTVNGGESFTAPSFAAAFAAAKASVLEKAKPAKRGAKLAVVENEDDEDNDGGVDAPKPKRAKKAESHISSEEVTGSAMAAPEILAPEKPNGMHRTPDLSGTLAEACLTMAQTLTELAGKLQASDALLPFRGAPFVEEEPATPVSERKVLRTTRGK